MIEGDQSMDFFLLTNLNLPVLIFTYIGSAEKHTVNLRYHIPNIDVSLWYFI